MTVVAVAGGTGKLGRAIVEALKRATGHSVLILARSANDHLSKTLDVPVISVDYSNVDSLSNTLEENKIDTIISAVPITDDSASESQLNLIDAAIKSPRTKRFVPSEFGIVLNESHAALFPPVKMKLMAARKLETSDLEYTLVSNGLFMDYWGQPKVKTYLQPFVFAVDMANDAASIPGSGDVPVVFTHTFDVAKYMADLVGVANWPKRSIIIGDKITWNEMVALAEATKGTKFDVKYDAVDKLKTFQVTELPAHTSMYPYLPKEQLQFILAVFGQWTATGDFNLSTTGTLNERFPEIKPLSMGDMLQQAWKV